MKGYSNKQNAVRAAKAKGLDPATLVFTELGAEGWIWAEKPAPAPPRPARPTKAAKAPAPATQPALPTHAPETVQAAEKARRSGVGVTLLLQMLSRNEGATVSEIVAATGWQPHTTRARISATVGKQMGKAITTTKDEARGRVYRIAA